MSKHFGFANSVAAGVLAAGLGVSAAAMGFVVMAAPAYAQALLSAAQIEAIQSSLKSALRTATTDPAKEGVIAQSIPGAVALYSSGTAGPITSVIMLTAEGQGVAPCVIGNGIAQASANLAGSNLAAANAIAATMANEGNAAMRTCYQTASLKLGYANLAAVAGQEPAVTGGTTGGAGGGGQGGVGLGALGGGATGGGAVGGGGGGCLNPSCTKL